MRIACKVSSSRSCDEIAARDSAHLGHGRFACITCRDERIAQLLEKLVQTNPPVDFFPPGTKKSYLWTHHMQLKALKCLVKGKSKKIQVWLAKHSALILRTGVGDESDAVEPEDRADSTKAEAYKTAQSNEGTKKKGLTRRTILSSRKLKRMEPDSEDWDKEAIEFHHVDEERLNERIKALIEWEDKENNTYSPAKLPRTGDWAQ
ncbi:hypothetical protein FRC00_002843, partial [Tulasnella sp. 408]